MKKSLLIMAGIVCFAFQLTSCKKELPRKSNAKVFNLEKFSKNIQSRIGGNSPQQSPEGYSFIVTMDGKIADSFSFGNAYTNVAAGRIAWNTKQEINVASVTKTLTAVAVLQLLKKHDLKDGSLISRWIRGYVKAHDQIKNLEFYQLLTHSSGITASATDYASLRQVMRSKLADPEKTPRQYSNVNFAMFRIIIPYLIDSNVVKIKEAQFLPRDTTGFEKWLSATYINYMQQNVFTPAGLGTVNCTPSANTAMAYSEPRGIGQYSESNGDWTETCAGGGFYMSVLEMSKWIVYLTYTNTLLDNDQRKMMDKQMMGWDPGESLMTIAGQAYGKDGALLWDSNKNGVSPDPGDAGLQTLLIKFPNKVELALAINSIPGAYRNLGTIITSAYDMAWE